MSPAALTMTVDQLTNKTTRKFSHSELAGSKNIKPFINRKYLHDFPLRLQGQCSNVHESCSLEEKAFVGVKKGMPSFSIMDGRIKYS